MGIILTFVVLVGCVSTSALGQADEGVFNKLLAPGPLMEDHKDLEHGDCLKCHEAGKGVPDRKCLDCHTDIAKSVKSGDSFHANVKKPCIDCHSDHKGRNFDSTKVNTKTFNHNQTGFSLTGEHAKLKCTSCHSAKDEGETRFFGLDDKCVTCHKTDDVHFFKGNFANEDCGSCHKSAVTWKDAKFDHKAETGYALVGDHATLKCATCHVPNGRAKYDFPELASKKCLTCHDDFHKGKLGPQFSGGNCSQCHSQTTWKGVNFDHSRTGFTLKGEHAKLACASCHSTNKSTPTKHLNFTGLNQDCASCHKDYHGFRNEFGNLLKTELTKCQTCHNENAWKPFFHFNHNTHTEYPITGKHIGVRCFDCHKTNPGNAKAAPANSARKYEFPELPTKTCETCHKSPHEGGPNSIFRKQKCSSCHTTAGWGIIGSQGGAFDHSRMTQFPLTGDHAKLPCKSCHMKNGKEIFSFANQDKQFCVSCHTNVHKDQFNANFADGRCTTCHNTTDFRTKTFDHNLARFKLTGSHAQVANNCAECHTRTNKLLPTKPPKPANKFVFAHPQTGFCSDCHKDVHKAIKPQQFSDRIATSDCRHCHNVNKFANLLDFDHDNRTRFKIVGAHEKFEKKCVECHVKTKQMLATSPPKPAGRYNFPHADAGFCEACHKDVHKEQFSTEFNRKPCTDCHTQVSFDQRLPFNHNTTSFKLTGAHAKFGKDCVKCHTPTAKLLTTVPRNAAGKFQFNFAARGYCEACHVNEHKDMFRAELARSACRGCHTTTDFEKMGKFDHNLARFELHGKHTSVKCGECHTNTKERYKEPPQHFKGKYIWNNLFTKDCALCHKDPHNGDFGPKCSNCHTEEDWDETANFHKHNMLSGTHNLLTCNQCHVNGQVLTGTGTDCKLCHQKDDIHFGSQPNCQECHTQQFWSAANFHHSQTNFPLRGTHRTLDCVECHAGGVYQGLPSDCQICHADLARTVTVPNHSAPGFENCESCHNQFSFSGAP
jgi:hypothetical protein